MTHAALFLTRRAADGRTVGKGETVYLPSDLPLDRHASGIREVLVQVEELERSARRPGGTGKPEKS